jgi:hypothetical protein
MAGAACLLLAGCTRDRAAQPERGTRLASLARSARLNGRDAAEFPCPQPQPIALGDLSQAVKYATVAVVEPIGATASPAGGDEIRTWTKFRIMDMLHDRRGAGLPLAGIPSELAPLAANQFVAVDCGGTVTINGVRITQVGAPPGEFHQGHAYLVWFELSRTGSALFAWRGEGVFAVDGDTLRPITADSADTPFDRDLITHVGTSLAALRAYLAAH